MDWVLVTLWVAICIIGGAVGSAAGSWCFAFFDRRDRARWNAELAAYDEIERTREQAAREN